MSLNVEWPYRTSLHIVDPSINHKLLPHCKSAVAGGLEVLSASCRPGLDSGRHAICNPILADVVVQTAKV